MMKRAIKKLVTIERHSRDCRICGSPNRQEIENEIADWMPIAVIAKKRRISRPALYRHARALGLFTTRERSLKGALARFIERAHNVKPTAATFIAAITAYAKINADGEWVDKTENVEINRNRELFSRMNRAEMLRYAETGELPGWWTSPVTH
jgi:hypothetical protein